MVAELLRHAASASPASELADGPGNGLPDLFGVGVIRRLQGGDEQRM
jgi:hypothetical protein